MEAENEPQIDEVEESAAPPPQSVDEKICRDGANCIKDYFRNAASLLFKTSKPHLTTDALQALVYLAPADLTITPSRRGSSPNDYALKYILPKSYELDKARQMLRHFIGEGIENTDIYQNEERITRVSSLSDIIVGIREMKTLLAKGDNIVHQQTVVMGMEPELRALPALALAQRDLPLKKTYFPAGHPDRRKKLKEICTPKLKEIIAVAGDYGIEEILPIWDNLTDVVQEYRSKW